MALTHNHQPTTGLRHWLRSNVTMRLIRFMGVAGVALATSLVTVAVCDGAWHLTSVPTALISQVTGAIVSYMLSRWAWERKGKPNLLRETLPFWIAFVVATIISTLFTKLGYHMAAWMHLHGFKDVLVVEIVYFVGNVITFLMRFVFFHFVLFADRPANASGQARPGGTPAAQATPGGTPATHRRPVDPDDTPELAASDFLALSSPTD
jgi:putative flippase GtrA